MPAFDQLGPLTSHCSSGSSSASSIGKWVDSQYEEAFNETQIAEDLPDVRWGQNQLPYCHLPYHQVGRLEVRAHSPHFEIMILNCLLTRTPVIIVATNRGQTLRFFYPTTLNMRAEALRRFLQGEVWREIEPWSTSFAPGGDKEWIMDKFAILLTFLYNFLERTPKFIILMLTGGATSLMLNLLHRGDKKAKPEQGKKPRRPWPAPTAGTPAPSVAAPAAEAKSISTQATATSGGATKRKASKKK